jgi:hypothetical protein
MKIDELEWMDWLHKTRQEMEEERKRRGLSEAEGLEEIRVQAEEHRREHTAHDTPIVRDQPKSERQLPAARGPGGFPFETRGLEHALRPCRRLTRPGEVL